MQLQEHRNSDVDSIEAVDRCLEKMIPIVSKIKLFEGFYFPNMWLKQEDHQEWVKSWKDKGIVVILAKPLSPKLNNGR